MLLFVSIHPEVHREAVMRYTFTHTDMNIGVLRQKRNAELNFSLK